MKTFLKEHWVALISLFVAFMGGVPGSISIYKAFHEGPSPVISIANVIMGNRDKSDGTYTMMMFSTTVANKGNKPLNVEVFDLDVMLNNRWIRFKKIVIPEHVSLLSDKFVVKDTDFKKKDLQAYNPPITIDAPAYGYLMFESKECSLADLRNVPKLPIKIICTDVFGKQYKRKIEIPIEEMTQSMTYPKYGLTVETVQN